MTMTEHLLHVNTLFLTWQSKVESDRNQRYLVGMLQNNAGNFEFSYLTNTTDYQNACEQGFVGYPAFRLNEQVYNDGVMATFMKRLPPRSRRDFKQYLLNHHLPADFSGSDFDLITHTGIQLPSDGFNLIPNFSEANIPFDYLMEVSGTRHYLTYEEVENIQVGTNVQLECEDDNIYDSNAIKLSISGQKIGYINKILCPAIRTLLLRKISCVVEKISGTEERPLIYIMFSVS